MLKSYCSWHLFLPFATFTDAYRISHHDKSHLTETTSRSQNLDMSITMEPCFPLVYLIFFLLSLSLHPCQLFLIRDPGKRPTTGKRWDLACWCWQNSVALWRSDLYFEMPENKSFNWIELCKNVSYSDKKRDLTKILSDSGILLWKNITRLTSYSTSEITWNCDGVRLDLAVMRALPFSIKAKS